MKRLFFHVGPPKTATTSLQVFIEQLSFTNTVFLGIFQPRKGERSKELNEFPNKIKKYFKIGNDDDLRKSIRDEIQVLFEKYDNIIYSEEMILHKGHWRENIKHLFYLFQGFNVH